MTSALTWPPNVGDAIGIAPGCVLVLAPNGGPWTYDGTNTWIIGPPEGSGRCLVIDPGSDDDRHLDTIERTIAERGWVPGWISVTHDHDDHLDGARELAVRNGIDAFTYAGTPGTERVTAGFRFDELEVEVLHTPGHSPDSIAFRIGDTGVFVTGDTVLNQRSSAVYGSLASYFHTLDLLANVGSAPSAVFLPGHGPVIEHPRSVIDAVRKGRELRLSQVAGWRQQGLGTVSEIVDAMYPGITVELREDAELYVQSIVNYLDEDRGISNSPGPTGPTTEGKDHA